MAYLPEETARPQAAVTASNMIGAGESMPRSAADFSGDGNRRPLSFPFALPDRPHGCRHEMANARERPDAGRSFAEPVLRFRPPDRPTWEDVDDPSGARGARAVPSFSSAVTALPTLDNRFPRETLNNGGAEMSTGAAPDIGRIRYDVRIERADAEAIANDRDPDGYGTVWEGTLSCGSLRRRVRIDGAMTGEELAGLLRHEFGTDLVPTELWLKGGSALSITYPDEVVRRLREADTDPRCDLCDGWHAVRFRAMGSSFRRAWDRVASFAVACWTPAVDDGDAYSASTARRKEKKYR